MVSRRALRLTVGVELNLLFICETSYCNHWGVVGGSTVVVAAILAMRLLAEAAT